MKLLPLMETRGKVEAVLMSGFLLFLCVIILTIAFGIATGVIDLYVLAIVIGICVITIVVILRQDQLAAVLVLVVHIYVDWYLGFSVVAVAMVFVLLCIIFLGRSPQHTWGEPRALWLWGLLLLLSISPAVQGAINRYDAFFYYPNTILGALLMFWLGTTITRDTACVRRFFRILAFAGMILALLTIIQGMTGQALFASSRLTNYLAQVSNFQLGQGSDINRLGSFLINPDWNGAFFAIMLFIPLGLFVASSSLGEKLLYLAGAIISVIALLFTYSAGSVIAAIAGLIAFVCLARRASFRVQISLCIAVIVMVLYIGFSSQINHLFQHGTNPDVIQLRAGAWQTALRIIRAFPLMGIGLGFTSYLNQAEPFRVPAQSVPLAHPHNSYLEMGAMAGLPVLFVFISLLLFALWLALRNWILVDIRQHALFSGGIAAVIALSINSLSVNVWTLPPLSAFGWVILGVVSSPLLTVHLRREKAAVARKVQQ